MSVSLPGSVFKLESALKAVFSRLLEESQNPRARIVVAAQEISFEVPTGELYRVMRQLRDEPIFLFDSLVDITAVDYLDMKKTPRFAVVYHLLSLTCNHRLRVRVFPEDESSLTVPSMVALWPSANWMEREAFDMFGIIFEGHPDLRRLLTDYGFQGHPLRKDFPLSGEKEKRYDEEKRAWVEVPVTVEPRENVRRVFHSPGFADHTPQSPSVLVVK
ncbi:MAG: NADH-quinone oxidoreductase subunit C [Burkholderiales bacterium]|jgi:NADH-quinone oxidoreductase subunit C|nr:NADH-quinone oxidoreductase subunit C [Burkholderiales bacterium]